MNRIYERAYRVHDPAKAAKITSDGERNLKRIMENTENLNYGVSAVILNEANEQDELNALRERMHALELEHAELCNEMGELRVEMRRMSYRIE